MALDNRSGVVKIGNPPPGEVAVTIEAMRKHMMVSDTSHFVSVLEKMGIYFDTPQKFGNVQDVSSLPSGGLAVKFGSRREADVVKPCSSLLSSVSPPNPFPLLKR